MPQSPARRDSRHFRNLPAHSRPIPCSRMSLRQRLEHPAIEKVAEPVDSSQWIRRSVLSWLPPDPGFRGPPPAKSRFSVPARCQANSDRRPPPPRNPGGRRPASLFSIRVRREDRGVARVRVTQLRRDDVVPNQNRAGMRSPFPRSGLAKRRGPLSHSWMEAGFEVGVALRRFGVAKLGFLLLDEESASTIQSQGRNTSAARHLSLARLPRCLRV